MKLNLFSSLFTILIFTYNLSAQNSAAPTADEIIASYIELTGGSEKYAALQGLKMTASLKQGGFEMPLEIVNLKDGRQYIKIDFQGQSMYQNVYDGEVFWSTNFQTMKAEKVDAETQKMMMEQIKDFPDAFYNYKEKGYTAEFAGNETMDGADTYKIKLTKDPITIEGKEVPQITYYFFDQENFALIGQESEMLMGPQKGSFSQTLYSDYQEVEGMYFPFSVSQGIKGYPLQPIQISTIELNPEVDDAVFKFPTE